MNDDESMPELIEPDLDDPRIQAALAEKAKLAPLSPAEPAEPVPSLTA